MPKCNQCGAEVVEGAKFCPNCGAAVVEQKPVAPRCPQCGQEINPGAAFCPNCGFRLGQGNPAPAPAPQPAPAPAPQPQPYYQQPQPQPYYQPQPAYRPQGYDQPRGPLHLVRSLVMNIGMFLLYLMFILVLVVPMGGTINYFTVMSPLFDFTGVTNFGVIMRIIELILYFLPVIGFLSVGTVALVSGIQGLIRKEMPKYGAFGYLFGFYAPLFAYSFGPMAHTQGYSGFSFPMFQSPAFVLLFVALILYMMIGVAGSFLTASIDKKPVTGPIFKASAAVIGIVLFVFIFGATISVISGSGESVSPLYFFQYSSYLMSSSSEYSSYGSEMFIHGIIYIMSVIYCGMAMGELFSQSRRRGYRVSTIVMTGVSSILAVLTFAFYFLSQGNTNFISGMPSVCGYFVLFLAIGYLVLSNIAKNKEVIFHRRPMPAPTYPRY